LTCRVFSTTLSKKEPAVPKVVDAREQRRQIRRAARRVFSRRGVAGTGLAHVADAAGMGRSSLYHYYADKAALLRELGRELLAEEEALFAAAARGEGSPLERIERLIGTLVRLFDEWSRVGRMLLELRSRDARRFRPFFRRTREHLAALVAAGQTRGEIDPGADPQLTAAALIGTVDGLLLQYFVEPAAFGDPAALRAAVVRLVRRGLAP
jgi:AcrR family transcriptional regulator